MTSLVGSEMCIRDRKSQFEASGKFDSIDTQIAGLGEIKAIQDLYVAHTADAINE